MAEPTMTTDSGGTTSDHGPCTVPWTKRDVFWATVLGIFVVVGLLFLLMLVLEVLSFTAGLHSLEDIAPGLVLLAELGLLLPVWALGIRKYRVPWSTLGFRRFEAGEAIGLGCLLLLFAFGFNVLWALLMAALNQSVQPDTSPLIGDTLGGLSMALLGAGIVVPVAEEAFFRGFVFCGLRRTVGLVPALALSAAMFAIAHITPTSWPPVFVLGISFALLYEQTGSLWPAIFIHGLINSIGFVFMYLSRALSPF